MTFPDGAPRLILYVGKGGVGKTTLAAATAARSAALGRRTLVVSTDIAHNLGDVLDCALSAEPREVAPLLYAQEINVLEEARRSWGKMQEHIAGFLQREGIPAVQADELAVVPGMQEIAALVRIGRYVRDAEYDCIIVDAAPTGETIRLLTMPESFDWYARKVRTWRGKLNRVARAVLRSAMPDLSLLDFIDELREQIAELRTILTDPTRSSYRIVLTPDRTVLKEAQRAETYLGLFDYPVDAVVLNRVMDEVGAGNEYLESLLARQREMMLQIAQTFSYLPVFTAPLTRAEPIGMEPLLGFAEQVFGARDPTEIMHVGRTIKLALSEEGYVLSIPMPNVEAERLVLNKRGDELYVNVGNFRREIALPATLATSEPQGARLRSGVLEVRFRRGTGAAGPLEAAEGVAVS